MRLEISKSSSKFFGLLTSIEVCILQFFFNLNQFIAYLFQIVDESVHTLLLLNIRFIEQTYVYVTIFNKRIAHACQIGIDQIGELVDSVIKTRKVTLHGCLYSIFDFFYFS